MIELSGLTMTDQFAEAIGHSAMPGDNLILTGDLGAGKTTLTKGIAQGLGITQMIKSPTYTIIREYSQGRIPLYHMDIYRVAASGADLGLDEYFEGDDYLELILEKSDTDLEKRYVKLISYGEQSETFKQRILEKWAENHE